MREKFQVERVAPLLLALGKKAAALCRAGIVDQDIETAEIACQRIDQPGWLRLCRQIDSMDRRLAAERADFLRHAFQCRAVARREHDVAAGRRQFERNGAADAAACPGDKRYVVGKAGHVLSAAWSAPTSAVRISTSDLSVRCTGHLSAISRSRLRCSSVRS